MPIYEFRCQHCQAIFDDLCKVDEDGARLKCPRCGNQGATRLISVFTARGLENGHHGIGKTWGGAAGSDSGKSSEGANGSENSQAKAAS